MSFGRNHCYSYLSTLTNFLRGALPITGVIDERVLCQKSIDPKMTAKIRARIQMRGLTVKHDMKV